MKKNYQNIKTEKLPKSEYQITGEVIWEELKNSRDSVLASIAKDTTLHGFRKGAAPSSMVASYVGEMPLLQKAAEECLKKAYPNILDEFKIEAVGRPNITITKIAPDNSLEFKITTAVMPEIKLPDYKKIAKGIVSKPKEKAEITEKEIEDILLQVRKDIAKKEGGKEEIPPELTPETIKKLGAFKDLEDLKNKIRDNLLKERESRIKEKIRIRILEELAAETKIDLPEIIVISELDRMIFQFKEDLTRTGFTYEKYLQEIKKTDEKIRNEWRPNAEKKARAELVINKIARAENISPSEEEIKRQMDKILEVNKDAERFRVRMYVEMFLTNEKVLVFLESQE